MEHSWADALVPAHPLGVVHCGGSVDGKSGEDGEAKDVILDDELQSKDDEDDEVVLVSHLPFEVDARIIEKARKHITKETKHVDVDIFCVDNCQRERLKKAHLTRCVCSDGTSISLLS